MKMKTYFIIFSLFIVFLSSCVSYHSKYSELEKENQKLKQEIITLKTDLNKYQNMKYIPIFYPQKDSIKLGEDYNAIFYVGMYDEKNIPTVIIYSSKNSSKIDTLKYDRNIKGNIFSYSPKQKGHYIFLANMNIPLIEDTVIFKIKWGFNVY